MSVTLHQGASRLIADVEIQTAAGNLCTGRLRWLDDGEVRAAMLEFEALANDQIFPLLDEVELRVERMGVSLLWCDRHVVVTDLQVFEDENVSFRCAPTVVEELARGLAPAAG